MTLKDRLRAIERLIEGLEAARAAQAQASRAMHCLYAALYLLDPAHPEFQPPDPEPFRAAALDPRD